MPQIQVIAVGRLREPYWKDAAEAYTKRLQRSHDLTETIVKDGDASLNAAERTAIEGERILQVLKPNALPICLDEHGKTMTSVQFAGFLQQAFDQARSPCFIIGGAYGLARPVKERAAHLLSLGSMTFPHELARVLLFEQLYRADSILRGRPYHHE